MVRRCCCLSIVALCVLLVSLTCEAAEKPESQWVTTLREKAEKGDARAQFTLGQTCAIGIGIPKNDTEAVKWYRKAADQGVSQAQFHLGESFAGFFNFVFPADGIFIFVQKAKGAFFRLAKN